MEFGEGESRRSVIISIIDDTEPEPDEVFEVILASPKAGAVLGDSVRGEFGLILCFIFATCVILSILVSFLILSYCPYKFSFYVSILILQPPSSPTSFQQVLPSWPMTCQEELSPSPLLTQYISLNLRLISQLDQRFSRHLLLIESKILVSVIILLIKRCSRHIYLRVFLE